MATKQKLFSREEVRPALAFLAVHLGRLEEYYYCGSYRRGKSHISDIDILLVARDIPSFHEKINHEMAYKVLAYGNRNVRILLDPKFGEIQVDFMIVTKPYLGSSMLHLTGSKMFNIICRRKAKEMGLKLNEYGLFTGDGRNISYDRSESFILGCLGLNEYLDPRTRSL